MAAVEVSTDGGRTWRPAELDRQPSPWAWAGWSFAWEAASGSYELCSRATDAAGNTRPLEATWNTGGYVNNAVQRVEVTVTVRDPRPGPLTGEGPRLEAAGTSAGSRGGRG